MGFEPPGCLGHDIHLASPQLILDTYPPPRHTHLVHLSVSVVQEMKRFLCFSCLLGLMSQSWLYAQPSSNTASLDVLSMPVECAIQMPRDSKDWVKKTSEVYSRKNLQAGEYEVFGRFEGRTLKETVTLKAGKTQTVVFNFLVRDLSEIPADSPAQQALEQLNQAKLYHVENRIAQAWQAIQQAKTLYTDDPEIQSVYQEINTQRNREINTIWVALQKAQQTQNPQQVLASLAQMQKLSPNHPGARQVSNQLGVEFNALGMMMLRVKAGRFAMGAQQSVEELIH